jgi:chemotaxis protein MotB
MLRNLFSTWRAVLLVVGLLTLSSCTAKYQDMLRDRDETIRDLEGKLATARTENNSLRQDLARNQADSAAKTGQPETPVPGPKNAIRELEKELTDAGVKSEDVAVSWRNGMISIGINNKVTFTAGSTRISPEGESVLKRVAGVLKSRYQDKKIYVEGHTDTDPIQKTKDRYRSNRHLSAERADSVASYLVQSGGLRDDRIVIVGYGPNDPASNAKSENRRVEIVVAN